jgi:hypothetical protein
MEGSLLQHDGTGYTGGPYYAAYIVIDGVLRWIPDPTTLTNLFGKSPVVQHDLRGYAGFNDGDPAHPPYYIPALSQVIRAQNAGAD